MAGADEGSPKDEGRHLPDARNLAHATQRRFRWVIAWSVLLYLAFLAYTPGGLWSNDMRTRLAVAEALWQRGTVFIDPNFAGNCAETPWGKTSYWGIGETLLAIPFDMLGAFAASLVHGDAQVKVLIRHLPFLLLYFPLVGLGWFWAMVWLGKELGLTFRQAIVAGLIVCLSSIALVYIVQEQQEESLVGCLVTLAAGAQLRWQRTGSLRMAALVGLLAGLSLLVRPNAVFALLVLARLLGDALLQRSLPANWFRALVSACAGAVLPLPLSTRPATLGPKANTACMMGQAKKPSK